MNSKYLLWRAFMAFCCLHGELAHAGMFDNNSDTVPSPVFTTPLTAACMVTDGNAIGRYETIEEARFALRNALLNYSKACQTTSLGFYRSKRRYNEVVGYVVRRPDGKYDISRLEMGSESRVRATKPDGAVESMHTHPWYVTYKKGEDGWFDAPEQYADLGPSGGDVQAAKDQGIPAFALDCATGDVYGASPNGKALKMVCDDDNATCGASMLNGQDKDHIVAVSGIIRDIDREFSQQELDARYQEYLRQQQVENQMCYPENLTSPQGPVVVPLQSTVGESASTVSAPGQAYETVDNRELKQWGTDLLNDTYSRASGIADSEGFGAEYRSQAQPILNQGLNYIQSIPDQMQVPVGQQ